MHLEANSLLSSDQEKGLTGKSLLAILLLGCPGDLSSSWTYSTCLSCSTKDVPLNSLPSFILFLFRCCCNQGIEKLLFVLNFWLNRKIEIRESKKPSCSILISHRFIYLLQLFENMKKGTIR